MSDTQDGNFELAIRDSGAIESQSRAEIDIQIKTAKTYPRKELSAIKSKMLSEATLDEDTAAACFYKIPRGGGMIEGPSVRLAEITFNNFGNLRLQTRVLETVTTGDNPHVTIQVAIHDLETNNAVQVEKRRRITGKKHNKGKPDEDDINLATNACTSIAFRDAVFRIVPNVLIIPVFEACKKVAVGKASSLSARRAALLKRLAQMGVSEARVLASMKIAKVEDITMEHVEELVGRGTALKDGGVVEEIFPIEAAPAASTTSQPKTQPQTPPTPPQNVPQTAPAQPAAASPAPEPIPTNAPGEPELSRDQAEVERTVREAGFTFDDFARWGEESCMVPNATSFSGFHEIDSAICRRISRAKVGLIEGLNRITGRSDQ